MLRVVRGEPSPGRGVLRFTIDIGPRQATYADVLHGWRADAAFRDAFHSALASAPYSAFRWETPAVTAATSTRPFEFVLLDSPSLARHPDPEAFAEHFKDAPGAGAVAFPNLGGDAVMVVPCPSAAASHYGHLAAFARGAPEAQKHSLWQLVGEAMAKRLDARPVWLSTAGAGVSWLHVRLDDRPKYYGFAPYRQAPI